MTWGRMNLSTAMSADRSVVIVKAPAGSTVVLTNDVISKKAADKNGTFTFTNVKSGLYTIIAEKGPMRTSRPLDISEANFYRISIEYGTIPKFTYTGRYELVDDQDKPIENPDTFSGNYKILFLTSGDLTISAFRQSNLIDAYLVGAGGLGANYDRNHNNYGGGGGGGRVKTVKGISLSLEKVYKIVIGAPSTYEQAKITSAFGSEAAGGGNAAGMDGADGGNGGGNYYHAGGIGGYNGTPPVTGGKSLDPITREFDSPSGKLYAPGGSGGRYLTTNFMPEGKTGEANTGEGGGGGGPNKTSGGAGGTGIVIIRNAR